MEHLNEHKTRLVSSKPSVLEVGVEDTYENREEETHDEAKEHPTDSDKRPQKKKKKSKKGQRQAEMMQREAQKEVKPPRIVFNAHNTQYAVIKQVAKQEFGWRVSLRDPWCQGVEWDIQWSDLAPQSDKFQKIRSFQKINHFPGMFQIARKNYLARNLKKMKRQFPQDYKFFPKTWLLPYEMKELQGQVYQYQKKNKKFNFIVKPECMSQGKGIFITKRIESIDPSEHLVVQKYLRTPYLIDQYKFDLRIYVLVTNVQPLRIFMHQDGLARFASEPYKLKSFNNPFVHLTNFAINKDNSNFKSDQVGEGGHKRSLTSVYKQLQFEGVDTKALSSQIKDIIVKTLISIQPDLIHHYRTCQPGDMYNNMCFEILGFDVIIDNKGRPFLLEVNQAPSFNGDTQLDQQVKKNLLVDTFKLLNVSIPEKAKVLEVLRQNNEQRKMGVNRGNKEKQHSLRQDFYNDVLKDRDMFDKQNLGGFEILYPPMTAASEIDSDKLDYYQQFQEHAKNYMMDFKIAKQDKLPVEETKQPKNQINSKKPSNVVSPDKKPRQPVISQTTHLTTPSMVILQNQHNSGQEPKDFEMTKDEGSIDRDDEGALVRVQSMCAEDNPQSCDFKLPLEATQQATSVFENTISPHFRQLQNEQQTNTVTNQGSKITTKPDIIHTYYDQTREASSFSPSTKQETRNSQFGDSNQSPKLADSQQRIKNLYSTEQEGVYHQSFQRVLNILDRSKRSSFYQQKPEQQCPNKGNQQHSRQKTAQKFEESPKQRYKASTLNNAALPVISQSQAPQSLRQNKTLKTADNNQADQNTQRSVYYKNYLENIYQVPQVHLNQRIDLQNQSRINKAIKHSLDIQNSTVPVQLNNKYFSPQQTVGQSKVLEGTLHANNATLHGIPISQVYLNPRRQRSQLFMGQKDATLQQQHQRYLKEQQSRKHSNVSFNHIAMKTPEIVKKQPLYSKQFIVQGLNKSRASDIQRVLRESQKASPKRQQANTNNSENIFNKLHQDFYQQPHNQKLYTDLNQVVSKLQRRNNNVINKILPQLDKW